jgi:hypothetical protein
MGKTGHPWRPFVPVPTALPNECERYWHIGNTKPPLSLLLAAPPVISRSVSGLQALSGGPNVPRASRPQLPILSCPERKRTTSTRTTTTTRTTIGVIHTLSRLKCAADGTRTLLWRDVVSKPVPGVKARVSGHVSKPRPCTVFCHCDPMARQPSFGTTATVVVPVRVPGDRNGKA